MKKQMPEILITNDDGADSPMLKPMAEALSEIATVRMVIPAKDQSWQSKSISRFGTLSVEKRTDFGVEAYAVSGTPADCVNIGAFHLSPNPPDWVVSGVNIGHNTSLAYSLNSATVGAAIEAALVGIPAVAFSQYVPVEFYRQWVLEQKLDAPGAKESIQQAANHVKKMMARLMEKGLPENASLLSVNFPKNLSPTTSVRWTRMMKNRYGSLFAPHKDGFRHTYKGENQREPIGNTDKDTIEDGEISVTAMNIPGLCPGIIEPFQF